MQPGTGTQPEPDRIEAGPASGDRRPDGRPSRLQRADVVLGVLLALYGLYSIVLLPLQPAAVGDHTVLWEALTGSDAAVITGGALVRTGHASAAAVLGTGIFGTINFDYLYWWGGRRWGQWWIDTIVGGRPRTARLMARIQRSVAGGWAVPVMLISHLPPVPSFLIYIAVGWSGMSLARFLALDLIAGAITVLALGGLGYAIGHPAVHIAKEIAHYGWELGLLIAAAVVVSAVVRERRRG